MKRKFTFLITAALMLLTMMATTGTMWGQTSEEVTLSSGSFSNNVITWTCADGNITIQQLKGSGSSNPNSSYVSAPRVYKQNILSFVGTNGYTITQIDIKCDGSYYGTTKYAGTEIESNNVDNNTAALTPTWSTANGGTHTIATVSDDGLSEIYIQNGHSSDANSQLRITKITITYKVSGSLTATTVTINTDNLTNSDVYVSTTAGSLSASVTETESGDEVDGATVTWSSGNTSVATIDEDGVVTLVAVGTTTITASYAGESGVYSSSSATYDLTVISSEPYVQPTTIEITPNYTFWGKTGQFSGSTYSELSGSKDNVSLDWSRGSGSTYANTTAMRFYKDNTLVFTAPTGYEIKSIVLTGTLQSDMEFAPTGFDSESKTWTGSSETVTMSRPSTGSSYATISQYEITIGLASNALSVTYNGNGNTSGSVPTDDNEYESGDEVTVLGNTGELAKTGFIWSGWNTQTDGEGTAYQADDTFEITASTTLYAMWTPKAITGLAYTGTPTATQYDGQAFNPAGLTVTATFNDESQEDVTSDVVWTPNPLTIETTSVTGTYMEQTVVVEGITVTYAPGTENNPYTVAQAMAAIDAQGTINEAYVTGIISQVDSYNSNYKSITYWISDDGATTTQLEVYSGKGLNGADFSSINDVQVGATVVVKGKLKLYNQTYEFDYNNELVSYTAPQVAVEAPTFSLAAGGYAESQTVAITCATDGAQIYYTNDGTDPTNESFLYDEEIDIEETTTIKAIAYIGENASTVSSATYYILSDDNTYTVTQALEFGSYPQNNIFVQGIVSTAPTSLISGGLLTYYISADGTSNELQVYKGKNLGNTEFTAQDDIQVGDAVTIFGNVKVYNSQKEFDQGNYLVTWERLETVATPTFTPEEGEYTEAQNVTIACATEGATIYYKTAENAEWAVYSEAINVAETTTIWAYAAKEGMNNSAVATATYTINIPVLTASITVYPLNIEATAAETVDWLAITLENIDITEDGGGEFDLVFCDNDGNPLSEKPAWFEFDFSFNDVWSMPYTILANTETTARTLYFKIYGLGDDGETEAYSDLVTVTQAGFVVDFAELPFEWEGGLPDAFNALVGTTLNSVGSYPNQTTYQMKLDSDGDYIQVKTNEQPGVVTIGVKMVGGGDTSTLTVQGSADGETFTDVEALTISGSQNDILTLTTTNSFAATDRYVRLLFTKGSNVGVGPIMIAQVDNTPAITLSSYEIDVTAEGGDGTLTVTYKNIETDLGASIYWFESDGETPATEPDWMSADINETTLNVDYIIGENDGEARTAYFKVCGSDSETNLVYSELVTVSQDAYVAPTATITVYPLNIEATAAETENWLAITLENIVITEEGGGAFDLVFCDNEGEPLPEQSDKPDWFAFEFSFNDVWSMPYTIGENTATTARTLYFKIYGLGDDGETEAYSDLVTVTQAGFVVDYAELPFEWEGGSSADFSALNGVTLSGNGSDYGSTHAPYLIKLDSDGDYIMVKTNSQPGIVAIGVKMIGGGNTSTITVQGSVDGETFDDGEALEISGNQNDIVNLTSTRTFGENVRYVKLYFTKGSNVGVGPITIASVDNTPSITVAPDTLNLNCDGGDGELTVTHKNLADDPQLEVVFYEADGETETTYNWITASINATTGNVDGHIEANTGEARTAYLKVTGRDTDNNLIKSNLVTFNQGAYTEPSIVFETTTLDIVAGGENRTMSFDYEGLGQSPTFSINFYESDGTTEATYSWITANITQDNKVNITVSANEGTARSAYFKVYGENGEVNALSNLVTISQAAFVQLATYSLVTDVDQIVSGKHYVIASGTNGNVKAMGGQATNNRNAVNVSVSENTITETEGMFEFVINGPQIIDEFSYFTIYDTNENSTGYLYAAGAGGTGSNNHLKTRATIGDDGKGIWTITITDNKVNIVAQATGRNTMRYNSGSTCFSCYASGQQDIYLYVKNNDNNLEYYGTEINYTATSIPAGGSLTVGDGTVMTVPNDFENTDPTALIIEDGGQLIHESDVEATVQIGVSGYGSKSGSGWYLISSPVAGLSTSAVATGTYDLFAYDEATAYWWVDHAIPGQTANHTFDTLSRGKGYLYANSTDVNLNYAGTMKATNTNIKVDLSYACDDYPDLKGFNLVGNPFTRNLVHGDMKIGGEVATSYLILNNDEEYEECNLLNGDEIKPGQGFFIQATATDQQLEFNPSSKDMSAIGLISIKAGDENYTDKAYIQFGGGNTLRKMTFGENTMVYVMNDDLDYATARVDELAGTMPVHFDPVEDGFYTITVETKNIENLNYMHLIDNITNTDIDLLAEPSYTFKASESDNADRFHLVFDFNNYTGVNENYTNDNFAHQIGDEIFVSGEGTLQVFDVLGRFVTGYNVNGDKRISTAAFNTGVYIFRMVGTEVKTQKIIVR